MGRNKLTTEQYIEKCKQIHAGKYAYDCTAYSGSHEKVCIRCPIHGKFEQQAARHLSGYGCKQCGTARTRMSQEEFLNRCAIAHNHKYNYSDVSYLCNKSVINIGCPTHGIFKQQANKHLHAKTGCPLCANKNQTTVDFIEKAKAAHGDIYDYSQTVYTNDSTKLAIVCPTHGEFHQTPSSHHSLKQGCPTCGRVKCRTNPGYFTEDLFRKNKRIANKPGILYLIHAHDEVEQFLKIGITSQLIRRRFAGFPYDYQVLATFGSTMYEVFKLEQYIKQHVASYQPVQKFGGWTECFSVSDLPIVQSYF